METNTALRFIKQDIMNALAHLKDYDGLAREHTSDNEETNKLQLVANVMAERLTELKENMKPRADKTI